IEIGIYNINGQAFKKESLGKKMAGEYSYQLNTENLPNGIYFVQLIMGDGRMKSHKLVVK
ncbi:MAG: T9SS type A sorting domain-containing protein, partial [Saprospiraceae bacterium]